MEWEEGKMEEHEQRPRFIPMTCTQEARVRLGNRKDLAPLWEAGERAQVSSLSL